jgi:hemin uptake protein HemP
VIGERGKRDELAPAAGTAAPASATTRAPRMVSSDALLRGDTQLAIVHEQTLYYLRRTRFGKLILTK